MSLKFVKYAEGVKVSSECDRSCLSMLTYTQRISLWTEKQLRRRLLSWQSRSMRASLVSPRSLSMRCFRFSADTQTLQPLFR